MAKKDERVKISLKIGDKDLGVINVGMGASDKQLAEMVWKALLSTEIIYQKGQLAQIKCGEYTRTFKVKKPFVFHGIKDNQFYVTIPVSLETLRGLGFITRMRKGK